MKTGPQNPLSWDWVEKPFKYSRICPSGSWTLKWHNEVDKRWSEQLCCIVVMKRPEVTVSDSEVGMWNKWSQMKECTGGKPELENSTWSHLSMWIVSTNGSFMDHNWMLPGWICMFLSLVMTFIPLDALRDTEMTAVCLVLLTADFIHEKSCFRHIHTSFYCKTFMLSPHCHCFSAT